MQKPTFLEKLLDGVEVEWKALEQLAKIKHGKDWKGLDSGDVPVYGSGGVMGYVNTFSYDKPTVLIPRKGTLTNVFYVETPFWNVDTIYYTEIDTSKIFPKYLYHFIKTIDLMTLDTGSGRPSLTQAILNKIQVPIPCPDNPEKSLRIQREIVRILDTFTELTAELTAELNLRKQQYQYYRDQLLTFNEGERHPFVEKLLDGVEVEWLSIRYLCDLITTGKLNANAMEEDGTYPFFTCNEKPYKINSYAFDLEAILISGNGSQVGHLNYYKGKFNAYQRTYVVGGFKDVIQVMYLFHYLNYTLKAYITQNSRKGSVPYITMPMLENFKIPIPCPDNPEKSLRIQREIVRILDKFDTLVNSLTEGLPREIELRQKQYEYYRDLLLSFPKPDAEEAA